MPPRVKNFEGVDGSSRFCLAVAQYVFERRIVSIHDVATRFETSKQTARRHLLTLVHAGLVSRGSGAGKKNPNGGPRARAFFAWVGWSEQRRGAA